uniref:Uncharacterized protein n=1 Tax=Arundo donax TaxID=35708 RepID=A0A0A9AUY7_ARUDO
MLISMICKSEWKCESTIHISRSPRVKWPTAHP